MTAGLVDGEDRSWEYHSHSAHQFVAYRDEMDGNKLLGEFLRARRQLTRPAQVGLLEIGSRRTPGPRREEVAMLAGVSTDYYVRLETFSIDGTYGQQIIIAQAEPGSPSERGTARLGSLAGVTS